MSGLRISVLFVPLDRELLQQVPFFMPFSPLSMGNEISLFIFI